MEMMKNKLLEYLKHAIELESSILTQKNIISTCDSVYEERKPKLILKTPSSRPEYTSTIYTENGLSYQLAFGIILVAVGLFFFFMGISLIGDVENNSEVVLFILASLIVFGGSGIACIMVHINRKKKDEKTYQQQLASYHYQNEQIEQENQRITTKYNIKLGEWKHAHEEAHTTLNRPLYDTQLALDTLYAKDIIYPKYRTLPALTSIYEYLLAGRCEELTGPHGAYNMYEDEIRKDTVISQLNTVIENLEQIRQNQYMLYEQIKDIQRTTRMIAVELYQITEYTAKLTELTELNTYYNGIDAMNSTALAYCRSL